MKLIHKNFLDDLHKLLKSYEINEVRVIEDNRIEFCFDDFADKMSVRSYEQGVFTDASTMQDYRAEETEFECSID